MRKVKMENLRECVCRWRWLRVSRFDDTERARVGGKQRARWHSWPACLGGLHLADLRLTVLRVYLYIEISNYLQSTYLSWNKRVTMRVSGCMWSGLMADAS